MECAEGQSTNNYDVSSCSSESHWKNPVPREDPYLQKCPIITSTATVPAHSRTLPLQSLSYTMSPSLERVPNGTYHKNTAEWREGEGRVLQGPGMTVKSEWVWDVMYYTHMYSTLYMYM